MYRRNAEGNGKQGFVVDHHTLLMMAGGEFPSRLWRSVTELYEIERQFGLNAVARSARYCADALREAGAEDVELLSFPADGQTTYGDALMLPGWEPISGRLEITSPREAFDNPVIADFGRSRFHVMMGSMATRPGGVPVEIVSESMMLDGHSVESCLVLPEPHHTPAQVHKTLTELGGDGIVSDYAADPFETPDGLHWHNDLMQISGSFGFCVSPRVGRMLRRALADYGKVTAHVEIRAHEGATKLHAATGILRGREMPEQEIWIVAHLGEPFGTGSCTGAATALMIASQLHRLLKGGELPPLRRTIRFVFATERRGLTATLKTLSERGVKPIAVLLAESHPIRRGRSRIPLEIRLSPISNPLFSDTPFRLLTEYCLDKDSAVWRMVNGVRETRPDLTRTISAGELEEDALLADPMAGAPCFQICADEGAYRHNSANTLEVVWPELLNMLVPLHGAFAHYLATLGADAASQVAEAVEKECAEFARGMLAAPSAHGAETEDAARRMIERRFANMEQWFGEQARAACERPKETAETPAAHSQTAAEGAVKESRTDRMARTIIFTRTKPGFPIDQIQTLIDDRRELGKDISRILALTDGERSLLDIIRETEILAGRIVDHSRALKDLLFLAGAGYLESRATEFVTKADLIAGLRKAGVREGDLILAHASMSAFGHVQGGAETCVDALLESVGPRGTVLMPTFTNPYVAFEGAVRRRLTKRPYYPEQDHLVTGAVSKAFLKRAKFRRSNHPSHSVAGIGPLAGECLDAQRMTDPPTSETSAFAKLPALGGKIVYLGALPGSSTFLHYLETRLNLPYLMNAMCWVYGSEGALEVVHVPRHLAGHRDFGGTNWAKSKVFRALAAAGLKIANAPVGLGAIRLIDAKEFLEKGLAVIQAEPTILLCDNTDCLFCVRGKDAASGT